MTLIFFWFEAFVRSLACSLAASAVAYSAALLLIESVHFMRNSIQVQNVCVVYTLCDCDVTNSY